MELKRQSVGGVVEADAVRALGAAGKAPECCAQRSGVYPKDAQHRGK